MRSESEKFFHLARASVEHSSDTIFWLDANARIVYANAAASRVLGYTNEALLGMTIHDIDHLFPPEAWLPHVRELKEKGSMCFESKHWARDGRIIPVEVTCNYFELDGEYFSFAFNRDISERQSYNERLKLTQFAVDRMSDSMLWLDESAKVYYANDAACRVLGYGREELLQKRIFEIDPDFPESGWQKHIEELRKSGSMTFESRHIAKDGRVFPVEVTGNYIEYGEHYYSVAFDRDISERKRMEQELALHREQLELLVKQRTSELEKAMAQLMRSEKLAALGNLVAGVAHELNTPLGNSRIIASSLMDLVKRFLQTVSSGTLKRSDVDAFSKKCLEAFGLLDSNASRAAELIEQFKQVSVDQTSMRSRSFDLRVTVDEVLATLQPMLKHTAVRIEVEIPSGIVALGYPGALGQILVNLVTNSLTHAFKAEKAGVIAIRACLKDEDRVEMVFCDSGSGIADEIKPRVFDPFFTTNLGQGGSGLGLYIVHNLVTEALGGSIAVGDNIPHGACFTIEFPLRITDHGLGGRPEA